MQFREVTTIEEASRWLNWLEYEPKVKRDIPFALRARIHNHMMKVIFK